MPLAHELACGKRRYPDAPLRNSCVALGAGLPAVAAKQRRLVPVEGIEPPCLAAHDFESCASTSSATRAHALSITPVSGYVHPSEPFCALFPPSGSASFAVLAEHQSIG